MTKLKKLWKIRLSGTGGQGLISASIILAEALIMDGENVVQSQSYGAEARGGASKGEVIVSNGVERILYPKVDEANVLLCLSREALKKYLGGLSPEGILIVDSTNIPEEPETAATVYHIPITRIARTEAGAEIAANIVALGVIAAITKIVPKVRLIDAIAKNLPTRFLAANKKAFDAGYHIGKDAVRKTQT